MPSDAVKRILSAEAESDRLISSAKERSEEMIRDARQKAAVSIQKKISEANAEASKIRSADAEKLKEYRETAQAQCSEKLQTLRECAGKNSERAVDAIISGFFS